MSKRIIMDNDFDVITDKYHSSEDIKRKAFVTAMDGSSLVQCHGASVIIETMKRRVAAATFEKDGKRYINVKKIDFLTVAEACDLISFEKESVSLSVNGRNIKLLSEVLGKRIEGRDRFDRDEKVGGE